MGTAGEGLQMGSRLPLSRNGEGSRQIGLLPSHVEIFGERAQCRVSSCSSPEPPRRCGIRHRPEPPRLLPRLGLRYLPPLSNRPIAVAAAYPGQPFPWCEKGKKEAGPCRWEFAAPASPSEERHLLDFGGIGDYPNHPDPGDVLSANDTYCDGMGRLGRGPEIPGGCIGHWRMWERGLRRPATRQGKGRAGADNSRLDPDIAKGRKEALAFPMAGPGQRIRTCRGRQGPPQWTGRARCGGISVSR